MQHTDGQNPAPGNLQNTGINGICLFKIYVPSPPVQDVHPWHVGFSAWQRLQPGCPSKYSSRLGW